MSSTLLAIWLAVGVLGFCVPFVILCTVNSIFVEDDINRAYDEWQKLQGAPSEDE